MLTFESTHEYYMGNDANILYCDEHESLVVTQDYQLDVLPPPKFYRKIEDGHSNRDLEINRKFQWNYEKANQ